MTDTPERLRERAKAIELAFFKPDRIEHPEKRPSLVELIATAMHEIEQTARAEAAKIADEYADWTYWGQYDNGSAAEAAAAEIAQAIRLGRPLTAEEIRAADKGRIGVPKLGGDKAAAYKRGRAEGERAGAERMREAAMLAAGNPELFRNYVAGPLSLARGIQHAINDIPIPAEPAKGA